MHALSLPQTLKVYIDKPADGEIFSAEKPTCPIIRVRVILLREKRKEPNVQQWGGWENARVHLNIREP